MSLLTKQSNKRILLVDDEEDVLEFLKIFLESKGWEVEKASTPSKALAMLRQKAYFLAITDIAMPEMDGYEFISSVKQQKTPVEIAVMTGFGYNPKHTLVKINKTMKHPCLFKPFNRNKVIEVVQKAHESYHSDL